MEDILNQMEEDSNVLPDNERLEQLSNLAMEQLAKERELAEAELVVARVKEELRVIAEVKLPEIFTALNLMEFRLKDGTKVECKPFYAGNISEENKDKAFSWLRSSGHGDLIKHVVSAQFGKGEDAECAKLTETLRSLNLNYTDKESVHPMTLKAFIREQVESGAVGFPMDLFSVHVGRKAKVAIPKTKGGK
jgi:hypothetical protein